MLGKNIVNFGTTPLPVPQDLTIAHLPLVSVERRGWELALLVTSWRAPPATTARHRA